MRQAQRWVVLADRSMPGETGAIAIGWPLRTGGALVARLAPAGIAEVFANVQLGEGVIIAAFDQRGNPSIRVDQRPGFQTPECSRW